MDTSALLAIVLNEPERDRYASALLDAERARISSATWFEAAMVVDRRGDDVARARLDDLLRVFALEIMPFTGEHATQAREAWRKFGKGVHKAALNFGDCLTYGVAKTEDEPLLFKGNDFTHTDIEPALKG